jgi:hypothetical protein
MQTLTKVYKASHLLPVLIPILGYYFWNWGAESTILFFLLEFTVVFFISWLFTFAWAILTSDSYQRCVLLFFCLFVLPVIGVIFILSSCAIIYLVIFVGLSEFPEEIDTGKNYEGFRPLFFVEKIYEQSEQFLFSDSFFFLELLIVIIPVTIGLVLFTLKNYKEDKILFNNVFQVYGNFFFSFFGLFMAIWFTGLFKHMGASLIWFALSHWYAASKAEDDKKEQQTEI